jgi:hypothetical protein
VLIFLLISNYCLLNSSLLRNSSGHVYHPSDPSSFSYQNTKGLELQQAGRNGDARVAGVWLRAFASSANGDIASMGYQNFTRGILDVRDPPDLLHLCSQGDETWGRVFGVAKTAIIPHRYADPKSAVES